MSTPCCDYARVLALQRRRTFRESGSSGNRPHPPCAPAGRPRRAAPLLWWTLRSSRGPKRCVAQMAQACGRRVPTWLDRLADCSRAPAQRRVREAAAAMPKAICMGKHLGAGCDPSLQRWVRRQRRVAAGNAGPCLLMRSHVVLRRNRLRAPGFRVETKPGKVRMNRMKMIRLLLLFVVSTMAAPACDDSIPGLCKTDRDCPSVSYCDQGFCVRRDESFQDASVSDADGGMGFGSADAALVRCSETSSRCEGNTPEVCLDGGWAPQTACSGATPMCSNGICGAYRVTGRLRTIATVDGGLVRHVSGSLELGTRSCSKEGLCVVGGIVP
jgi:hypothetical protein